MVKIARNDACWCGSGKKYKKCHLNFDDLLQDFKKKGFAIPPRKIIKTEDEIARMRKAGDLTRKVLDMVSEKIKEGVTTEEINTWVHEYTVAHDAYPAPLNYKGYPKSTCVSINEVICHGIPNEDTVLKDGDIVNVDVTCILNDYYADSSRMFLIGTPSEEAKKIVSVTKECLDLAIAEVKPFAAINKIGHVIENHAHAHNYSVVRDLCGHGLGKNFHEEPQVLHYRTGGKGMIMVPGMTFTIEPMINEGTHACKYLDDGWTVVTKDGKLSAQWEHTLLVTNEGVDILT